MPDKRPRGLARRPNFAVTAEDRLLGAPGAVDASGIGDAQGAGGDPDTSQSTDREPTARRRPLKVDAELADQLRNAVLFLRGRGRPALTQNELIDELIDGGLDHLRTELNNGQPFPDLATQASVRSR